MVGGLTNTLSGKKSLENVGYRKVYQPKTNKAIQCLNHLLIFKLLDSIEIVKVRIKGFTQTATNSTAPPLGGLDLVYERERPIQMATRQGIKHHIALTAIRKIVGPDELIYLFLNQKEGRRLSSFVLDG